MSTPTVPVTVTLVSQDGVPYQGVTVRARLDVNEVYQGFIISDQVEATTDADGVAVLQCFPNAPDPTGLGTQGSTYRFWAAIPGGRSLNAEALVPNAPCRLENILVSDAPPELTAAELALLQAQAAVTSAANSAAAAEEDAVQTAADREQTGLDRVATGEDRAVVESIAANYGDISDAVAAATFQAGIATTKAGEAADSADLAQDWATKTDGEVVTGQGYGARKYKEGAEAAQAGAAASEAAATKAAATSGVYPNSAGSNVPRGLTQASVGAITPGSGGTNGTFNAAFSGGTGWLIYPTATFTVAGNALTAFTITGPGLCISGSPAVPTVSFAASSGLTGAAVALTTQLLVTAGQGYWVQSNDGEVLDRYTNTAGAATRDTGIESIPTTRFFDADEFPGTRNLYGPILTPRPKDLAASNFATAFPPDAEWTVSAGTSNDYTAAIDGLTVGQPFIIYVRATSGTIGVLTFTHNGAKTLTEMRRGLWAWEGTAEATTASIVVKNGSGSATLTGYVRYATGPTGATGDAPQESSEALESFFDAGMPTSDQELLRASPLLLAANASSAITTVTTAMADVALGDTIVVLARAEMLNGDDATMDDVSIRFTATSEVIYSLYPLAEHPGWWYREIYLDPAAYTGGTITLVRTNAKNLSASSFYEETPRYVTHYVYKTSLPRFYPSAAPDEGRGIQSRGNMRSRTYATTSAAEYNGYLPAMFGGVRRLWLRSAAGGDYLVVRKDPDTGDFIGSAIAVTHPGGGWKDFTTSIPISWKRPHGKGFVVGYAPNPSGTPGLVEYGSTVVGDTAFTNSSWKSGTTNGDDLTLFAGVGERIPGIYCEVEDRPGAVNRMGPLPLTRTGPADYQLDFILGQSGYEGYALTAANFHDYSKLTPAASLMWSKSQAALVPLHDPAGQNFVGGGSLWPAYAKEYEERMKSRAVIVVNSAVGGTKIETDWFSSSTGAKAKWTDAIADYNAALNAAWAANLPISGVAVHIDLGEGNGLAGTSAATFKAHLVAWIAAIRALVSPYVPIFYRPPGRGAPADVANFAQIRVALMELVNEDPYFHIASNGEAITEYRGLKAADHYHDTLPAQEESGRLLAALTPVPASKAMPKNYTLDVAR